MNKELISKLQPLFSTHASLVRAQDKLNERPRMDCQIKLHFIDSTFVFDIVLDIARDDVKKIISEQISNIENSICEIAELRKQENKNK